MTVTSTGQDPILAGVLSGSRSAEETRKRFNGRPIRLLGRRSGGTVRKTMGSDRTIAVAAGVLFIVATVASLLGTAIEQPVLNGLDYLTSMSANPTRIAAGGLLELVAAGTSVGIALSLYPVLKNWSAGLALGSVVFRTIEAVMYTVGAVTLLSLSTVSDQLASAASADRASLHAIGESMLAVRQEAVLAGVFAFSVGALMYYLVFYRSGLIPVWLSGWGVAAAFLMLVACLSALFGRSPVTSYTILIIPIAVQEMVLAPWLIVKGFGASTLDSGASSRTSAG